MIAGCLAAAGLVALPPHPDSRSSSQIAVEGARASVVLHCQARSLVEALDVDANRDGALVPAELEAARARVGGYLLDRYRLYAEYGGESSTPLSGRVTQLSVLPLSSGFSEPWVRAELVFEHARVLESLCVRVRLFREENPLHRDEAQLVWNGRPPARFSFGSSGELWRVDPLELPQRRGWLAWVREGLDHILGGPDHLAFVCALLLAAGSLRALAGVVTAFTVAHSITLALAVLGWVRAPALLVELAIALSIAYVALLNLLSARASSRWPEALVFGLVHGLGFAAFLGDLLFFEPSAVAPLVGFNIGVECGQLLMVIAAVGLLRLLPGDRSGPGGSREWLAPRWLRLGGSILIAALGLAWFADRAFLFR